MSEYEYLDLLNGVITTNFTLVSILFSLISAFLAASYLVAHKMRPVLAYTLLLIYSIAYYFIGGACLNGNQHLAGLVAEMTATDFDFSWTPATSLGNALVAENVLVILSYVVSLFFFIYLRRFGRNEPA